jgi:ABC-2 type transport system permease protein
VYHNRPRTIGIVNGRGLWSLYLRGVRRYFKYVAESLAGPMVSSLLFVAVFAVALGPGRKIADGVTVLQFIAPGIAVFSLAHSAFENAAFNILYDKLERMIEDVLVAPLSAAELMIGYALSAATCGIVTGTVVGAATALVVGLPLADLGAVAGYGAVGALLFALIGTLVGLWADRWDGFSAAESFLILPLGLLSGTFFSIHALPELGQRLILANPVFYLIDGFRSGFIGYSEGTLSVGLGLLLAIIVVLAAACWRLFAIGYKIRA